MRVLVIGGAGYIGAHTVQDLRARGDEVVVIDDLSTGEAARLPGMEIVRIDVAASHAVGALVRELEGADAVIHFAALKRVDESFERPDAYQRVNVEGTRHVLEAMAEAGTPRLVFSSTAAVYGAVEGLVSEDVPPAPVSPYGATKLAAEALISGVAAAQGIAAASLRYFNVAGSGGPELRERAAMNLIPQVLRRIDAGERPQIFGTDYPTPDGTCVRDFVHVLDVSAAHLAVLDALGTPGHRIYNVGTGSGSSVLEVVRALLAARGTELEPELLDPRPGDPASVVADVQRIWADLGWAARYGLADVVASAIAPSGAEQIR